MNVISSVFRWVRAKSSETAEAIETANAVAFARQDLENLEKDRDSARNAIASIKAEIARLERDVNDKKAAVAAKTADAEALLAKGKEDLAKQVCALIEDMEGEIPVLEKALEQQRQLCLQQEQQFHQLNQAVSDARRSLKMMQTMEAVAASTEKAAGVKIGDGSNALARFKKREAAIQMRLDKAQAASALSLPAEQRLDDQVKAALGSGKGVSVLARLKAREMKQLS
ncbi:MAG: PspA/IM30 family protein [Nitrospinae bacterium]|nr:PspA/IM30 family protein [Nitrospinota bacterium]